MNEGKQPEDLGPQEDSHATAEQAESASLEEQLEEALREKEQFRTMAQRAQADLVNYRRRAAEEQDEIRNRSKSQILLKILSVVDDFNRALDMIPEDAVAPGWFEGLQLVQRNLENVLTSEGVTKIDAKGQPFEPWQHEAVFYEPVPDMEEGMVVSVFREGYKLHDKVLRAVQVSVSKPTEETKQSENEQQEG